MSLIQRVTARNQIDLINEGLQYSATGVTGGMVTNMVVVPISTDRAPIVMGFTLTSAAGPTLVSIGFKKGSDSTIIFFEGHVASAGPVTVSYGPTGWYRGDLGYNVVLTSAGNIAYSIDAKVTSFPAALGYVEHEGGQSPSGHMGRAWLPPQSGLDRGQSEV